MGGRKISDEKMITALLSSRDIATASSQLGISRQAIYNRLQQPLFRKKLQTERQAMFQVASNQLTDKMSAAIETLSDVMQDVNISARTRIRAAQIILDICLRTSEQMDIIDRITAIEETLESR